MTIRGSADAIVALGPRPTRVERLAAIGARSDAMLWVKRDDLSSPLYGGNKVRKLERFFGRARAEGKTKLLTLGAAGSNQLVALARFSSLLGFSVEAVVVSQPYSARGVRNLRVALAHGLRAVACPSWTLASAVLASRWRPDAFVIPLGGSSVLGSLGFVDAAGELAAQIAAGELPVPDAVVVPLGSGGTAAGLAVGLEEARLRTRVIAVAVASPPAALRVAVARLTRATARARGLDAAGRARAAARVEVTGAYLGGGYAVETPEGAAATRVAEGAGLVLDGTYTAKAFACALDRTRVAASSTLFWHTLSSRPLPDPARPLPPDLERLFVR